MKFQLISSLLFVFIISSKAWDLDQLLESSVPDEYSGSIEFANLAASQSNDSKSTGSANSSDVEGSAGNCTRCVILPMPSIVPALNNSLSSNKTESKPTKSAINAIDRVVLAVAGQAKTDDKSSKANSGANSVSVQKNSTDDSIIIKSPKGDIKVTFIPSNQTKSSTNDKNSKIGKDDDKKVTLHVQPNTKSSPNSNQNNSTGNPLDRKGKSFTFDASEDSNGSKGGSNGGSKSSGGSNSNNKSGRNSNDTSSNGSSNSKSDRNSNDSGKPSTDGSKGKRDNSMSNSRSTGKPSINNGSKSDGKNNKNDEKSQNNQGKSNQLGTTNSTKNASGNGNKNFVPPIPTLKLSNASLKYDKFSFQKPNAGNNTVELRTNGKGKPTKPNQNDKTKGASNSTLINKMSPNANKSIQKNQEQDANKGNSTNTEQKRARRSVDEIESLKIVSLFRKIGFWAYLTIVGNVNVL